MRDISARLEVERLKSGFVSTVSHELRTPLTSISGSLGLLAGGVAGAMPAKAARLVDIARLNCERLVRLINDILDLEKAESGKLEFRLEAQRLKPIVEHAIDLNRGYAQTFGATIELRPGGDDPSVLVDRDRLIQVITNLLSNAAKFSPRGGTIHLDIRAGTDSVRILVRDEGPGISEEFRKRIFQKFAQADSLGLARQGRHGARPVDRQDHRRAARRPARLRHGRGSGHDVPHRPADPSRLVAALAEYAGRPRAGRPC